MSASLSRSAITSMPGSSISPFKMLMRKLLPDRLTKKLSSITNRQKKPDTTSQQEYNKIIDEVICDLMEEYEAKSINGVEEQCEWDQYVRDRLGSPDLFKKWSAEIQKEKWKNFYGPPMSLPALVESLKSSIFDADWGTYNAAWKAFNKNIQNSARGNATDMIPLGAHGDFEVALCVDPQALHAQEYDKLAADKHEIFSINLRDMVGLEYIDTAGVTNHKVVTQLGKVLCTKNSTLPPRNRIWNDTGYVLGLQIDDGKATDFLFIYDFTTENPDGSLATIPTHPNFEAPSLCNHGARFTVAKECSQGLDLLKESFIGPSTEKDSRVEIKLEVISVAPLEVVDTGARETPSRQHILHIALFPDSYSDEDSDSKAESETDRGAVRSGIKERKKALKRKKTSVFIRKKKVAVTRGYRK